MTEQGTGDDRDAVFARLRPRLRDVGYRMTGSLSDADDLCQDAWLRWSQVDRATVEEPEAYLVTTVTRLAIDRARSAARRREAYVGPFLPEPLVGPEAPGAVGAVGVGGAADPADAAALADSLTYAFLVMLDALGPQERAVLLLHDVFGYPFEEIAAMLDRSPAAVRQTASRARRKIERDRPPPVRQDRAALQATLTRLLVGLAAGDVEAVMAELAPDVVSTHDGGPHRRAARRPVVGPERVARLWINLASRVEGRTIAFATVNGQPGIVATHDGAPEMAFTGELDESGRLRRIWCQLNPEKLTSLVVDP